MNTKREGRRKSGVRIAIVRDSLEVGLYGIVTARILDSILRELNIQKTKGLVEGDAMNLIVDLSEVDVLRPGGAVGLVCLCSALMTNKMGQLFTPSRILLRHPSPNVLSYLTRIGFFTQMSAKAGLLGHTDLVRLEDEWEERDKKKRTGCMSSRQLSGDERSIIWPMHLIGNKENYNRRDFEDVCQHLVNDAANHFDDLFSSSHSKFDRGCQHDFLEANYELYMNVYDHSGSWGIPMIHMRPKYGTFICCYDIGIGIKESVNTSPNMKIKRITDYDAIKWALVEGNTSKIDGNGLGLNVIEDFVLSRKGVIEIRSGECLLQRRPNHTDWKPYRVSWFPGMQVNIFVPVA